ncbi:MAG: hypothetical protein COB12_00720 [Flavobacterium sp.]|nr:MAG: hypothetical protein COB12_00720 [Flavobacterium sp.]
MKLFTVLCSLFLLSCTSTEKKEVSNKTDKKFVPDMDVASGMTLLMRSMYDVHEGIKKDIQAGNTPSDFPKEFLKIFTAKLTDDKPYNDTFKAFSKVYIDNERAIFDAESGIPLKNRYNNAINTCISCHTTECVGPIPRIEKLLIN